MNPTLLLVIVLAYFCLLLGIAFYTSRNSDNESFFIGNRNSKWWLVAFGMIGTSLSGMTFISVPGTVGYSGLDYFQVVIGYCIGYLAVIYILLPIYYRMQLTSIYTYLESRFGNTAYKTGALFFIISRTLGATIRLYLVIKVLEIFVLEHIGISFEITAVVILLLILLYTYRGGVKTIVWTDTLQTSFMLLALITCVVFILGELNLSPGAAWNQMEQAGFTNLFNTDPLSGSFFLKQILGGAFITIAMTGLDQEMMQKNISVSNLKDSQKNMLTLSWMQGGVVFIFLMLGGLVYLYAMQHGGSFVETETATGALKRSFVFGGEPVAGDNIFPEVAFNYLPPAIGIIFIIGLISALFPSADGALTALTASFCIDILGMNRKKHWSEKRKARIRLTVHNTMAVVFLGCIFFFREVDNGSLIQTLLIVAGYTYGPLLALFSFGIFTKRQLNSRLVPLICLTSPILCFILKQYDTEWLGGYVIGTELLIINAALAWLMLFFSSVKSENTNSDIDYEGATNEHKAP